MDAYEDGARAPRAPKHAPWYVIPADHKWFMRVAVAEIIVDELEAMDPRFPVPSEEERAEMEAAVKRLEASG